MAVLNASGQGITHPDLLTSHVHCLLVLISQREQLRRRQSLRAQLAVTCEE